MKWLSIHFRLWTLKTSYLFIMLKSFTISQGTTKKKSSAYINILHFYWTSWFTAVHCFGQAQTIMQDIIEIPCPAYNLQQFHISVQTIKALCLPPSYSLSLSLPSWPIPIELRLGKSIPFVAHTKSHISKSKSKFNLWSRVASSVKPMTQWGRVAEGRVEGRVEGMPGTSFACHSSS